jgi:hypothetical protein
VFLGPNTAQLWVYSFFSCALFHLCCALLLVVILLEVSCIVCRDRMTCA